MFRLFSRLVIFGVLSALPVFLLSCGSSTHSMGGGSGSGSGTGGSGSGGSGSGGSGSGGSSSSGGFAAGIGGAGQTSAAHFLIAVQVPGINPFATTINPGGTLTAATATVNTYTVFNPMGMDGAIDPSGSFFYQAGEPGLWAFNINRQNGNLTEMSNSPYDDTVKFEAVAVDQLGKFVYAFAASQVYAYTIQACSGQLTPVAGSPFAASPSGEQFEIPFDRIAVSQDDRFLYVGASTGIFAYAINSSTGALTEVSGSPFGGSAGMAGAIVAPASGYLYELPMASSPNGTGIYGYSINSSTGALTALSGSPFGSNCGGSNLTSPTSGKFLFGAGCGMYQINASTGALTFLAADPAAPGDGWAVFDPPGDLVWIIVSPQPCFHCDIGPEAFQVDSNTGTLTAVPNSFFFITNSEVGGLQALAISQ